MAATAPVSAAFAQRGISMDGDSCWLNGEREPPRVPMGASIRDDGRIANQDRRSGDSENRARLRAPAEALYADVRSSLYRRSFSLGGELETGKIEASLKDGVLTVRIPKRSELRPRKIEVQSS